MLHFFTNPLDQFIITIIPNFFINFKCYIAIILVVAWLFLTFSSVHFILSYFIRVGIMKPERWYDNGNLSNSRLHTPIFDKISHFINSLITSAFFPAGIRSFFSFFYNLIGCYIASWWVDLRNVTLQVKYNFKLDPWYTFIFLVFSQLHGLFGYNYFFHNIIPVLYKGVNGTGSSKLVKRRLREFFDYLLLEVDLTPDWSKNRRNYTLFHSIRLYSYQSGFFRPVFWDGWVLSLLVGFIFLILSFLPQYQFYFEASANNIFFSLSNWEVMNSLAVIIPIIAALSFNPQIEKILITGNISPIKGYDWFLHLLFFSIITANLAGLIPSSMTATSFASLTFFLSFSTFAGINIIGLAIHGLRFTNLFYPGGAPIAILPFLIWIELISYAARAFSLGIRLFANMVAGHILIKIIGGWLWSALTFSSTAENKFFVAHTTIAGPMKAKGYSHFSPFFIFLIGSLFLFFSSARFKSFYAKHFYDHIEAISEQLVAVWTVFSNYSEFSPMKNHRTTSFMVYTNIKTLLVNLGAIDSTTGELIKDGWKALAYSVFTVLVIMLNYWFCLGKLSLVSAFIKMSSLFIFMAFVSFLVIYKPERNIQLISFIGLVIFFYSVIFEGSLNLTAIFSLVVYLTVVRIIRIEEKSQKILLSVAALLRLSFIIQMFIVISWLASHFLAFSWLKASSLIITMAGFFMLGMLLSLEFLIACLQAYVFVTLTAIYLKDVIKH